MGGEAFRPFVNSFDNAGLGRQDVPTGGWNGSVLGHDRARVHPLDHLITPPILIGQTQDTEQHSTGHGGREGSNTTAVERDPRAPAVRCAAD